MQILQRGRHYFCPSCLCEDGVKQVLILSEEVTEVVAHLRRLEVNCTLTKFAEPFKICLPKAKHSSTFLTRAIVFWWWVSTKVTVTLFRISKSKNTNNKHNTHNKKGKIQNFKKVISLNARNYSWKCLGSH